MVYGGSPSHIPMAGVPGQVEDLYMPTPMFSTYTEGLSLASSWHYSEFAHAFPDDTTELLFGNESSNPSLTSFIDYPTPELGELPLSTVAGHDQTLEAQQPPSEPLATIPGPPLPAGPGDGKVSGLTSISSTISACLEISGVDPKVLDHLMQGIKHMDEAYQSSSLPAAAPGYVLHYPESVQRSISAYIENVHIHYPIFDLGQLEHWRDTYKAPETLTDPLQSSRLCLLASIGSISMNSKENSGCPREDLEMRAWELIMSALSFPFIDAVEVLLLHTVYLMYTGKTRTAWVVSGLVIRIAQSLSLHQDMQTEPRINDKQLQRRANLWEVAYSLDAFQSLAEGRPPATTDHPKARNAADRDTPGIAMVEVHISRVKLARIANRLSSLLNRGPVHPSVLHDLADFDQQLTTWRDSIPLEYRPEQRILATGRLHSAVALLHLQYFNVMQTLHWASYVVSIQAPQPGFLAQCAPRIRSSETICLIAARSVIDTLNHSLQEIGQQVQFAGLPISYCMAAIAVLFRQILSQPVTISARILLEYLRGGNSHIIQRIHAGGLMDQFRTLSESLKMVAEVNMDGGTR
jgi:hypothetical protein